MPVYVVLFNFGSVLMPGQHDNMLSDSRFP
jgi:hypothetical protein